ncbi:MAG TPA: hypothetical protein HPP69_11000 [Deltaproteobacteria bacterium]|nr:hypothetical protein [Deltaproteobacteria bacterium]
MVALGFLLTQGCTRHEIESKHEVQMAPIEIKPIHITIDVNIKVDKALDDFFGDIDQAATQGGK